MCGKESQEWNIEALFDKEGKGSPSKKTRYDEEDLKSVQSKEARTIKKWSFGVDEKIQ